MGARLAYAIAKNIRKANVEYEVYNVARKAILVNTNAVTSTDSDEVHWSLPEQEKEAETEHTNLLEMGLPDFEPHLVSIEEFGNIEITPAELSALFWMIKET
jgi:hypothetical protein